ncbi:PQQ-binding-like beta-propeller repeat protein [Spiroplasma endosymbiont of Agriotes lineatus]|uniref:PQQ-binding-like beta-propeller repeat protein n=1 Tax=Spiroplasma endosymbiont of Agriotes lineatus TaxID=3077930 RepID=UPI0030D3B4AD
MKKLLEILGTITIASSGIAGIVCNAPVQTQEQQTKLENINYKRQKRSNNENNKINRTKIAIKTKSFIFSSGILLNNKIYFGSADHNVYEYDLATGQQKIIITTNGGIWSSGAVLNNKVYFGSEDHNVYEYDPTTGQQKIVIRANDWIRSVGVSLVFNNKLYVGSGDHNVYEYDPATGQQKIVIRAQGEIWFSGASLNNKIYFGSADHNVYEYDPATGQQKIVIKAQDSVQFSGVVLNNKVYFGSVDHNVYEYNPITKQQKIVIRTENEIHGGGTTLNNKLFVASDDHNVYEYDSATEQQKIVIITKGKIRSSGAVLNNKVYFGSWDKNLYEYDPITKQQKIVIRTDSTINYLSELNNKIYFGSGDNNVYEYSEYYLNANLEQINNNSDNAILNELNYLNPDLDISQLEIISKTNNSAIVKIKDNLNNNIKIHYSIDNGQNKIINLNELLKKALFFKFRDENHNLKFKEINYIDTNNLNFWDIEITKKENSFLWSNVPKNVCSDREIINKTPNTRSFNVPACEYNSKSKLVFQITTGLTKTKQENKLNGWNINSDDEMKLTDFTNINNKNSEIINVLSNEFDLSNTNKQEQEMILSIFKEPADKFELNPNEKLKITYPVRIITSKVILNLKQKITGNITAKIIDDNNKEQIVTLPITEVMQILQKYSLLPNEITIDKNNDKITFNGEAFFSSEREGSVRTNTVTTIV